MEKNKMQRKDGENNLAHGFCLRHMELEMRRITHECRNIYFLSKSKKKKYLYVTE